MCIIALAVYNNILTSAFGLQPLSTNNIKLITYNFTQQIIKPYNE